MVNCVKQNITLAHIINLSISYKQVWGRITATEKVHCVDPQVLHLITNMRLGLFLFSINVIYVMLYTAVLSSSDVNMEMKPKFFNQTSRKETNQIHKLTYFYSLCAMLS